MLRKATALRLCATRIGVRQCKCCGEPRPGSGKLFAPGVGNTGTPEHSEGFPCNTRTCPSCARRAARTQIVELLARVRLMESVPGYGWRLITLTLRRDPSDPETCSVSALGASADGLMAAACAIWKETRSRDAALYATLENVGTGHVHLHLLHYGPFLNKKWLEEVFHAAFEPFSAVARAHANPDQQELGIDPIDHEREALAPPAAQRGRMPRTDESASLSWAEVALLHAIDAAPGRELRLPDCNIPWLVAAQRLYARGVIVDTAPWTYRRAWLAQT